MLVGSNNVGIGEDDMGSEIRFSIPGEPQGKARPRVVRNSRGDPWAYTPDKSVAYEKLARLRFLQIRAPTKKPDADNVSKIILDALNGLAYHDDSQVVELTVKKKFALYPRVDVVLWLRDDA